MWAYIRCFSLISIFRYSLYSASLYRSRSQESTREQCKFSVIYWRFSEDFLSLHRSRVVVLQFLVIYNMLRFTTSELCVGQVFIVAAWVIAGREKVVEKESKLKARFRDPVHRHRHRLELVRLSALNARRRVASRRPAYLRSTAEIITWETCVHHTRNRGESSLFAYWSIVAIYASRK